MSLKEFEVLEEVGKGVYGAVFKVRRIQDNEIYAMKKVDISKLNQKEKENCLNEVRILASLNHQNIVSYKDAFYDDESSTLCIVLEYVDDGDLDTKISLSKKNKTSIPEMIIWRYLHNIVLGLKFLHDKKILHRDLKAANIFINKDGEIKLGDLNVSKVIKMSLLFTQTGTPNYASPEVWKDRPYDHKSDIWSLGCILYEMCALKPPFIANNMNDLFKKVTKGVVGQIPSIYSKNLSNLINMMLTVSPNQRPNCDGILKAISEHNSSEEILVENNKKEKEEVDLLLQTIRLPKNLYEINKVLPKAQYSYSFGNKRAESCDSADKIVWDKKADRESSINNLTLYKIEEKYKAENDTKNERNEKSEKSENIVRKNNVININTNIINNSNVNSNLNTINNNSNETNIVVANAVNAVNNAINNITNNDKVRLPSITNDKQMLNIQQQDKKIKQKIKNSPPIIKLKKIKTEDRNMIHSLNCLNNDNYNSRKASPVSVYTHNNNNINNIHKVDKISKSQKLKNLIIRENSKILKTDSMQQVNVNYVNYLFTNENIDEEEEKNNNKEEINLSTLSNNNGSQELTKIINHGIGNGYSSGNAIGINNSNNLNIINNPNNNQINITHDHPTHSPKQYRSHRLGNINQTVLPKIANNLSVNINLHNKENGDYNIGSIGNSLSGINSGISGNGHKEKVEKVFKQLQHLGSKGKIHISSNKFNEAVRVGSKKSLNAVKHKRSSVEIEQGKIDNNNSNININNNNGNKADKTDNYQNYPVLKKNTHILNKKIKIK